MRRRRLWLLWRLWCGVLWYLRDPWCGVLWLARDGGGGVCVAHGSMVRPHPEKHLREDHGVPKSAPMILPSVPLGVRFRCRVWC